MPPQRERSTLLQLYMQPYHEQLLADMKVKPHTKVCHVSNSYPCVFTPGCGVGVWQGAVVVWGLLGLSSN